MTINPEINKLLQEHNIDYTKGMLVLFSLYFGLPMTDDVEKLFYGVMMQINVIKIVDKVYPTHAVIWNIPLFLDGNPDMESEWIWVNNEYRPLFRNMDKDRAGSPSSCLKRMKTFFAQHPSVRKEDVIAAAKLYIDSVSDVRYLQSADYFIVKGKGTETTSRLEQYLEIVKENKRQSKTGTSTTKMM